MPIRADPGKTHRRQALDIRVWYNPLAPQAPAHEGRRTVASKAEVERALRALLDRLSGNAADVRSAIPGRRVFRCDVPDLSTSWYSVVADGKVSTPTEEPPDGPVDITLRVDSDAFVDLVEGRLSFVSAFASGKVRVDASIMDLLRLRALL